MGQYFIFCRKCLSETTAHGLNNIVNENTKLKRIIWFCFTLFALSIFMYHTTQLTLQLISKPVSIVILPNSVRFPQPDIYLCFDRAISNSYLRNPPKKDYKFMKNLSDYINRMSDNVNKFDVDSKSLNRILSNIRHEDFFRAFGHRLSGSIVSGSCGAMSLTISLVNYKNHLACIKITPEDCMLRSPWNKLSVELYLHNLPMNEYDADNNINIKYNDFNFIDTPYGLAMDEITDDIQIYFEHPSSTIDSDLTKVTASSKTHTKIQLSARINKKINRYNQKCSNVMWVIPFYNYFNRSGELELNYQSYVSIYELQMYFKKTYNCVLADQLVPKNIDLKTTPFCLNIQHFMFNSSELNLAQKVNAAIEKIFIPKEPLCRDIKYNAKLSTARWPTHSITKKIITQSLSDDPGILESKQLIQQDSKNTDLIKENLYKITIQLVSHNATLVREELRYTWINFFSDVGGIMGFYLGASVLTLCELTKILCSCVQCKSQHKNMVNQKTDDKLKDERIELQEKR